MLLIVELILIQGTCSTTSGCSVSNVMARTTVSSPSSAPTITPLFDSPPNLKSRLSAQSSFFSVLSTASDASAVTWSSGTESTLSQASTPSKPSSTSTPSFTCTYGQFTNPAAQMDGPCSTAAVGGWCVCNSQTYGIISSGPNVCGYTAPPPTGTTSICGGPTSSSVDSDPSPSVSCSVAVDSKFIAAWDKFGVCGEGFTQHNDEVGNTLKGALEACGTLSEWRWDTPFNGCDFIASGRLPLGSKSCIEGAIKRAGGPDDLSCTSNGRT